MDDWLTGRFCCRLCICNQLGLHPLLSAQALKMIASPRLLKGASQCSQNAQQRKVRRALRVSRLPPLYWADVPLWRPLDARCVSTPVPFLLIHELVLQLVSDDTVGGRLAWADGRGKSWPSHWGIGRSASTRLQGPPCAAFSFWCDTATYHTGFDSVMLLLWSPLTGTVRQRFWFVALSKQTPCKCGCGGRYTGRTVLERREVLRPTRGMTEDPGLRQIGEERLAVAGRCRHEPQCCNFVEIGLGCRRRLDS